MNENNMSLLQRIDVGTIFAILDSIFNIYSHNDLDFCREQKCMGVESFLFVFWLYKEQMSQRNKFLIHAFKSLEN